MDFLNVIPKHIVGMDHRQKSWKLCPQISFRRNVSWVALKLADHGHGYLNLNSTMNKVHSIRGYVMNIQISFLNIVPEMTHR
jgi:hypothetical protein